MTFWQTLPDPDAITAIEEYLQKTETALSAFNPGFKPTGKAIVEYDLCDPPLEDRESEYSNGCKGDEYKEIWTVTLELNTLVRGNPKKQYKQLRFAEQFPYALNDVIMFGGW